MAEIEDALTKKQLREAQGNTYQKAVEYLRDEHVDVFAQDEVGDLIVSIACEEAEGMYRLLNGKLTWQVPDETHNQHLEVIVQDKEDLRFIPGIDITATVADSQGNLVAELAPEFLWHPFTFHYGQNFNVPAKGSYAVTVSFAAPDFGRHDEVLGKRYKDAVEVTFKDLELSPEREPHGAE